MRIGAKSEDMYDQNTYAGLVNRIRDGVSLTDNQKKAMSESGLTVEDFRNQKTIEEKVKLLNELRSK